MATEVRGFEFKLIAEADSVLVVRRALRALLKDVGLDREFAAGTPSYNSGAAGRGALQARRLKDFHRALRQRLHECPSVRFGYDSVVQDYHYPVVGFRPDQTPHALP